MILLCVTVWILQHYLRWSALHTALMHYSPFTALLVTLCPILRIGIQAYRMWGSAAVVSIPIRFFALLRWEFEIIFLEVLIPIPDSEDMFRIFFWQKFPNAKSKIITVLSFSRVCGLMALSIPLPF